MTALPDRDDQVMTLISAALALGPDERSSYLRVACGGDEELLEEIRSALSWEERMGGFLRKPWMSLQDLERTFKPGQVINSRFEIVREIGQGGMGIVYEAFDRKRGQRVAIKSAKLGFRRLLSPELESALRVRHHNICLVNEIHTAPTEYGDVDFLTMELLEGPTLQARLASGGPMEPGEALDIARQLCAGITEAHRVGIVHKDLKTANVILARQSDGTTRAVITDFGLAEEPAVEAGELAGTPQYMAPELWRGAAASTASDIYALGVILYEMLTGSTPFRDEPSDVRLTRAPAPPSSRITGIDKRWDAAILRCLDASPAARPSTAGEVAALIAKPRRRTAPIFAAATVLVVVALTLYQPLRQFFTPPSVRMAILPADAPGDLAALGNGALNDVADRLAHRGGAPTVVVIRPESLPGYVHTPDDAYKTLGATHALQIALRREGNDVVARGAVIDLATRTRMEEISGRYAPSGTGDLPTALTGAVAKALHLRGIVGEPISRLAATPYLQALSYLRRDQHSFDLAIPLFREAMRLDPHSPLPKAGLVEALVLRYQEVKESQSLSDAETALQAAEGLNPASVAVLLAAGRLEVAKGYYDKALDTYRRIADLQPRSVEVLLRIAGVYEQLDRRKEAIESYRKAIALEPGYYETYEEFGTFYDKSGEYREAAAQFRNVIAHAPHFHEGYTNLGSMLNKMGQDDAAVQALLASLKIKETARALNNLAAIKAFQKRDAEALIYYKRAYALDPGSYICLLNLGDSSRREGLVTEAEVYYRRGMELALSALKNNPRNAATRAFVGYFAARLGDHLRSEEEIEQALQFDPRNESVIRRAVLTFEMLGARDRALKIAETATPELLRMLDRHPDLADFRQDSRFRELKAKREKGG